eukprot:m.357603 g.357603  ORF g.357603 m.357603 type:complete len:83 (-) comp16616_c1_seq4:3024-3272(-)
MQQPSGNDTRKFDEQHLLGRNARTDRGAGNVNFEPAVAILWESIGGFGAPMLEPVLDSPSDTCECITTLLLPRREGKMGTRS